MIAFTLGELAQQLRGRLAQAGSDPVVVRAVSTDTRTLQPGDLFVALAGANFDGHDYLAMAAERGACAALVSRAVDHPLPQLLVDDTLDALGRLGAAWRGRSTARVVAVTGSNGKTTLKEMLAAVLARAGGVLATRGNLNNDIGVPLTLARMQDERYAVVEMGANHAGEIAYLSRLARPDVAVLNNAGRAHLEGFGSLEGVARAKAEIMLGLPADGVFVYNADDRFAPLWRELAAGRHTCGFGVARPADVGSPPGAAVLSWGAEGFRQRFAVSTPAGGFEAELCLPGEHNRLNALAAVAVALQLGVGLATVRQGLAAVTPVAGRLCPLAGGNGLRLIDDSYNANPDSVNAALAVLAALPGQRILVLGDLAELGAEAVGLHAALGEAARAAGIERLFTCGSLSAAASAAFGTGARHFDDQAALIAFLERELGDGDTVLIKGSRAARMERVVAALAAEVTPC